jgi:ABC-type Mn2+/Zn2+ transport system permease subunit
MPIIFGVITTLIVSGGISYTIYNLTHNILVGILAGLLILCIPFVIFSIMFGKRILSGTNSDKVNTNEK